MPITWLKEHIVKNNQFWFFSGIGVVILFMTYASIYLFLNLEAQRAETVFVKENQNLLETIKKLNEDVVSGHKVLEEDRAKSRESVYRLEEMVTQLHINAEYLERNRALWLERFDRMDKKLDELGGRKHEN